MLGKRKVETPQVDKDLSTTLQGILDALQELLRVQIARFEHETNQKYKEVKNDITTT